MSRTTWFGLLGLGFAVAGIDKLFGLRSYERMFRHWGWSEEAMRAVGAAELTGGIMVGVPATRRIGGAMLAATSATVLTAELRRSEGKLAAPRLTLLAAALTAFLP